MGRAGAVSAGCLRRPKRGCRLPAGRIFGRRPALGNPLYDWAHHEKTGFAWWVRRIRYALNFYDILRIDHFRGFDTYYAIPYGAKTAQTGECAAARA